MSGESFFSRWSRRKHAKAAGRDVPAEHATPAPAQPRSPEELALPAVTESNAVPAEPAPLPDVASLTPESDFAPFMQASVDPAMRRDALKTLFSDPRFNVMDGLDVYIDDYSKPDPLPEGWLEKLEQVERLGIFREPDPAAAAAAGKDEQSSESPRIETQRVEAAPPAPETPPQAAEPPITLAGVRNSERLDE